MVQEEFAAMAVAETEKGKKRVTKAGKATTKAVPQGEASKKRKAGGSHGVEVLKKVNVEGIQKISTFFQKKPKP